jgi:transcriptional regulator with XRE-family HTH domain
MINNADFTKRLEKIMSYYSLSASAFAEKIGAQRSSISHLLSGRNKPSLDFVMKILTSFPEINLYWLLNGTGEFLKSAPPKTLFETTPKVATQITSTPTSTEIQKTEPVNFNDADIERIVIFYKNGTFKNFKN